MILQIIRSLDGGRFDLCERSKKKYNVGKRIPLDRKESSCRIRRARNATPCFNKEREHRAPDAIKPTLLQSPFNPTRCFPSKSYLCYFVLLPLTVTDRETIAGERSAQKGPSSRIVPSNKLPLYLPSRSISPNRQPSLPCLRYIIRKTRGSLVQEIARP